MNINQQTTGYYKLLGAIAESLALKLNKVMPLYTFEPIVTINGGGLLEGFGVHFYKLNNEDEYCIRMQIESFHLLNTDYRRFEYVNVPVGFSEKDFESVCNDYFLELYDLIADKYDLPKDGWVLQ